MHYKTILILVLSVLFLGGLVSESVHAAAPVVVFNEPDFPAADTARPSESQLQTLFPGSRLAALSELKAALRDWDTRLFVLPYGSAFPEQAWEDIYQFLRTGGNLLVLGGRPFARSAYFSKGGWQLRDYSTRFMRPLMIDQYQETPGSGKKKKP